MPAPRRVVTDAVPTSRAGAAARHLRAVHPLVPLAVAAELTSVSDKLLWIEHLTLGGGLDLAAFREHLRAPDPDAADHEVVLQALEAVLLDEGVPVRVR